jgi:methionyl aminopeptidase
MIYHKTLEEIELIRQSALIVSKTLAEVGSQIKPGMTGRKLDQIAEEFIRDNGGTPGFKGYNGFPSTLCFSVNDVVVHGIPDDRPIESTDIVSVDCGVLKSGFYGDAAYTFVMAEAPEKVVQLCRTTLESLYLGISAMKRGNRIGDISFAIQQYCSVQHPYSVVREMVGHGLGKSLHEAPEVPNFGMRGRGPKLQDGIVLAIEPMINLGTRYIYQGSDGWTIKTRDGLPSAHFEHDVALVDGKAEVLSDHSFVEIAIKKNPFLIDISTNS